MEVENIKSGAYWEGSLQKVWEGALPESSRGESPRESTPRKGRGYNGKGWGFLKKSTTDDYRVPRGKGAGESDTVTNIKP